MTLVKKLFVSFVLGALLVLAFAPFYYWPLAYISLVGLFLITRKQTAKQAFFLGLAFAYGVYGVGVSWVYVSLSTYGGMPFWMGAIAVLGFAGLLSLFVALAAFFLTKGFPESLHLLIWPIIWLVFEWMKSWFLTGFPWLDLGYSQTNSWLFSLAPIGGAYLISFAVLAISALIAHAWVGRSYKPLFVVVAIFVSSYGLKFYEWTHATDQALTVGIVQANVDINSKWLSSERDNLINRYRQLSEHIRQSVIADDLSRSLDLVVWPETALPLYLQQTDERFWQDIVPKNTALLTGIVDSPSLKAKNRSLDETYNAAILSCDGQTQVYRKRHLVPFGEYLPLRFLFNWVLDYLQLPMSDMSAWQGQQTMTCQKGDINIGLSICYEDAFANEYRQHLGEASILVNISEDAWFGDSFAPHQRVQMAQMRARELGRPMVRSANTGPSLFIDHRGQVLAKTKQFSIETAYQRLRPQAGDTPYKRWGNWIVYFCLILLIGLFVVKVLKKIAL